MANKLLDRIDKSALYTAMRHLPSLSAIRAFEAAARHENFTAAGTELGISQAAVSYHVGVLEGWLGLSLFRREKKRVILTEVGRRVALEVGHGLDVINNAFAQTRLESEKEITISASTTFANTWLVERLGLYQKLHPDTRVRMIVAGSNAFSDDKADLSILSGQGSWPGFSSDRLVDIDFTPMCSPKFLEEHGGNFVPSDLLTLPIISPDDGWWHIWLDDAGIVPSTPLSGIRLHSQPSAAAAAIAGQGFALLTPYLWRNHLADQRLVCPFEQRSSQGRSYWLVCKEERRLNPKNKRFRDWLLAEVALDP